MALTGPRSLPTTNLIEIHSVVPQITHVDGFDIHIMCSFYALHVSYSQIQSRCKFTLLFYCFQKFCWILPKNSLRIPVTMRTGLVWQLTLYFLFSRHLAQEADVSYFGSSMAVINGEDGTWILPETRNTIDLFKLRNSTDNASAVTCKRHIQIYSWCARVVRLLKERGGVVDWGTALQARRSRVRFLMVSLEYFIDIILPAALWPWGRFSL